MTNIVKKVFANAHLENARVGSDLGEAVKISRVHHGRASAIHTFAVSGRSRKLSMLARFICFALAVSACENSDNKGVAGAAGVGTCSGSGAPCDVDIDCPAGQACNGGLGAGRCNLSDDPCDSDGDCAAGEACDTGARTSTTSHQTTTTSVEDDNCAGCGGGGGGGGNGTPTSTVSTTSTTLIEIDGTGYDITFDLDDTEGIALGSLQFDVYYGSIPGDFIGRADVVSCVRFAGEFGAINDREAESTLGIAAISLGGFTGPAPIAKCDFVAFERMPVANDFTITIIDAADTALDPVSVTVSVGSIVRSGGGGGGPTSSTTSTVSSTSTSTTSSSSPSSTIYLPYPSTTIVDSFRSDVTFDLGDTSGVSVGSLQFEVDYSNAPGGFTGQDDAVRCTRSVGEFASANDREAESILGFAVISIGGFTGPAQITECEFLGGRPSASDFEIKVIDAADTALRELSVTVTVGSINGVPVTTATTAGAGPVGKVNSATTP